MLIANAWGSLDLECEQDPVTILNRRQLRLEEDGSFDRFNIGGTGLNLSVQPCWDGESVYLWVMFYPERHREAPCVPINVLIGDQRVEIGVMPDLPEVKRVFVGEQWPEVWGVLPNWNGHTRVRFERACTYAARAAA